MKSPVVSLVLDQYMSQQRFNIFVMFSAEMRSKFDQGEDPMDPESQQGGGHHHHFHGGWDNFHGFNPFGSGPFNFKFNYN